MRAEGEVAGTLLESLRHLPFDPELGSVDRLMGESIGQGEIPQSSEI